MNVEGRARRTNPWVLHSASTRTRTYMNRANTCVVAKYDPIAQCLESTRSSSGEYEYRSEQSNFQETYFLQRLSIIPTPIANTSLFSQGTPLRHDVSSGVIVSNQSLVLQRVDRTSSGTYTCHGGNAEGDSVSNGVLLRVKCKSARRMDECGARPDGCKVKPFIWKGGTGREDGGHSRQAGMTNHHSSRRICLNPGRRSQYYRDRVSTGTFTRMHEGMLLHTEASIDHTYRATGLWPSCPPSVGRAAKINGFLARRKADGGREGAGGIFKKCL